MMAVLAKLARSAFLRPGTAQAYPPSRAQSARQICRFGDERRALA